MEIMWTIFELSASLYQGFLFAAFTRKFLGCDLNKKTDIITYSATSLLLFASFLISNSITHFEGIAVMVHCIPLFLYALIFLSGSLAKKAIAALLPILFTVIVGSVMFTLVSAVFSTSVYSVLAVPCFERFVFVTLANLVLTYVLLIMLKFSAMQNIKLKRREIILNLIVLAMSIVILSLLDLVSINSELTGSSQRFLLCCMLGIVVIDIAILYLVAQLSKNHEVKTRNELLSQQLTYQNQYTEQIKQQYITAMHLKHDINQSLSVLNMLLAENQYDRAKEVLSEYTQVSLPTFMLVNTKNTVLNAIVTLKLTYAQSLGIKTRCALPEDFQELNDIDLCNMIGNMLDNAIEYCAKHLEKENEIVFSITFYNEACTVLVKNTVHAPILDNNQQLKTSKDESLNHGFGLKTIKEIARKADGLFDCYEENGAFYVKVILYSK